MSAAEVGARLTPYELAFADTPFEAEGFPAIREEAEARGVDDTTPERFLLLAEVGRLLRELDAPGASLEPMGMLLFHSYHFWREGKPVYVVEPELARALPRMTLPADAPAFGPPGPAGYIQLPRNLYWARVDEAAAPEPVDGLFWTMKGADGTSRTAERVDVLLALGLRPGRAGFSVIPVGEPLYGRSLVVWASGKARPEGEDFANVLPGGELSGLFAVTTAAEALKLLALVAWYVAGHPDSVSDIVAPTPPAPAPSPHALPPSELPYRRIRAVSADG